MDFICQDPNIKAFSCVGSSTAGSYIHQQASHYGKRVQSNMTAKSYAVIIPDADIEDAINTSVSSVYRAAGQWYMTLSVVVLVGETQKWIPEKVAKAKTLKVSIGNYTKTYIAPLKPKD